MNESELVEGVEYEGEQVRTGERVRGVLKFGAWENKDANGRATAALTVLGEPWLGNYVWLDTLRRLEPVAEKPYMPARGERVRIVDVHHSDSHKDWCKVGAELVVRVAGPCCERGFVVVFKDEMTAGAFLRVEPISAPADKDSADPAMSSPALPEAKPLTEQERHYEERCAAYANQSGDTHGLGIDAAQYLEKAKPEEGPAYVNLNWPPVDESDP